MNVTSVKFDQLKISLFTTEDVIAASSGEVKVSETINYRKLTPEFNGLFCPRIFGTINDYECSCGKYNKAKYSGIICEKCGVLVSSNKVRRTRMGHINLGVKVVHPWYASDEVSFIQSILSIGKQTIFDIINYNIYVAITDNDDINIKSGTFIKSSLFFSDYSPLYDHVFESGGEAINYMLSKISLKDEIDNITSIINQSSSSTYHRLINKLRILNYFYYNNISLCSLIISVLPVLPAGLRPLINLDNGKLVSSDLNELYKVIINRNNRLKKILLLNAPRIIIDHERSSISKSVKDLFISSVYNVRDAKKSLSDAIKGKQGIFRKSMLGKRCDYSGRAVIVPGPELKIYQCGVPKLMMLKLMTPIIYGELYKRSICSTIQECKLLVDSRSDIVWDILAELIHNWPIILNRAPTLHKLGIQAFYPILIDGSAIKIHPFVCTGFNADFDGDQMAIHLPIRKECQDECISYMLAYKNIRSPSNGQPILLPSKDMVLGIYYLTIISNDMSHKIFFSIYDICYAVESKVISSNSLISLFLNNVLVKTTYGRCLLWDCINFVDFNIVNTCFDKTKLENLINYITTNFNENNVVCALDSIKDLAFKAVTLSGITFSHKDAVVPNSINLLISNTKKKNDMINEHYNCGLMTSSERDNKVIDNWLECISQSYIDVVECISKDKNIYDLNYVQLNNIYIMMISGARGSKAQLQQLCGMRGLMGKPTGEIHEHVILSNLKDGLNQFDYFDSTHGERKGLSDTALKTAKAGYFTRRLVDCVHACVIDCIDCLSCDESYIEYNIFKDAKDYNIDIEELILNKILAKDILFEDNVLYKKGSVITVDMINNMKKNNISIICLRSIIKCKSNSLCAKCYGINIQYGTLPDINMAVGIIAAQSIGEPGTQLTMRTTHHGGSVSAIASENEIITEYSGILDMSNVKYGINSNGQSIVLNFTSYIVIKNELKSFNIDVPYGSFITVSDKCYVDVGHVIANIDPFVHVIVSSDDGEVIFNDLIPDISIKTISDTNIGISRFTVIKWTNYQTSLSPAIIIKNILGEVLEYPLPIGTVIYVANAQKILAGDIIGKVPKNIVQHVDITGGLPKVIDMFECRKPNNTAILSMHKGIVRIVRGTNAYIVHICSEDDISNILSSYDISYDDYLLVQNNTLICTGNKITEGQIYARDILSCCGLDSTIKFIVSSVLNLYKEQGISIHSSHIEVIVRSMLSYVEIIDIDIDVSIKYNIFIGDIIKYQYVLHINSIINKFNNKDIKYKHVIIGITKVAVSLSGSYISSASFQHTIKVLCAAALKCEVDKLFGIKEKIITSKTIDSRKLINEE